MSKRTFIAVKINPDKILSDNFNFVQKSLADSKIKWVDDNNFHITLKFLGDTEDSKIKEINIILKDLADNFKKFEIKVLNFGVFSTIKNPKVLWFGTKSDKTLFDLQQVLENKLENLGFVPENRKFSPHLTIGRVNFTDQIRVISDLIEKYENFVFRTEIIDKIIFYESQLTPKGSIYKPINIFELK